MTQVLLEPFDNLSAWTVTGSPTIVAGRTGTALQVNNNTNRVDFTIPAPSESDWLIIGFAYRWTDAVTTIRTAFNLRSDAGATNHLRLQVNAATGALALDRAASALGSSAAGLVVANTWYYIEMQAKLADSPNGQATVRLNGTNVITLTGIDTKTAGTKTGFDTVRLLSNLASSVTEWDDLYIKTGSSETFSGDIHITTGANAKVWNGSAFVAAPIKVWNGTSFVAATAVKTWNGSAFV